MSNRTLIWIALAVLLFWWVGAYNRLMRLRAALRKAFEALDQQWTREVDLVRASLPSAGDAQDVPGRVMDDIDALWAGLGSAANQLAVSLGAARARPFDAEAVAALATARQVLLMAWQRVQDDGDDLAGAAMPQTLQVQWQALSVQSALATEEFNRAVTNYNDAIAQFPALLLAQLFHFAPARPL